MEDIKDKINEIVTEKKVKEVNNTLKVDNTIQVDSKLLVNVLNLIHKDHAEVIDCYNGLLTTIINSGKVKL